MTLALSRLPPTFILFTVPGGGFGPFGSLGLGLFGSFIPLLFIWDESTGEQAAISRSMTTSAPTASLLRLNRRAASRT